MARKFTLLFFSMILLPVLFALMLSLRFGQHFFGGPEQPVSMIVILLLPVLAGIITITFSSVNNMNNGAYKFFMPWIPVLIFFLMAFILKLEDCACWIIGLPVLLLLASLAGFTTAYLRLKKQERSAAIKG